MPKFVNQSSTFRIRGFAKADGSEVLVYGSDPAPVNADGSAMPLQFDQDVTSTKSVRDHAEPAPTSGAV